MNSITTFIQKIVETHNSGHAREHSYRPALKELFATTESCCWLLDSTLKVPRHCFGMDDLVADILEREFQRLFGVVLILEEKTAMGGIANRGFVILALVEFCSKCNCQSKQLGREQLFVGRFGLPAFVFVCAVEEQVVRSDIERMALNCQRAHGLEAHLVRT